MNYEIETGDAPEFKKCVFDHEGLTRIDKKQEFIEPVIGLLLANGWLSPDEEHWLALSMDEVVVNAMLHGNEGDPTLPVRVRVFDHDDQWVIRVDDKGYGFSKDDVPNPEDPDSLILEHGRGILLMSQWLDELRYFRGGATAILRKRKDNSEANGPKADA